MASSPESRSLAERLWLGGCAVLALCVVVGVSIAALPTTKQNFYIPGTQPGQITATMASPSQCQLCHADYNEEWAPFNRWSHSMHAQSTRDPIFQAAVAVAEQDAQFVGQLCYRCHAPQAWISNKVKFNTDQMSSKYGQTLALDSEDLMGVSCSACHRMVDPVYQPGSSPAVDQSIIAGLNNDTLVPPLPGYPTVLLDPHDASMVIDPEDRRRGPFNLDADWGGSFPYHQFRQSPFHLSSRMCATCHDVSTPHFTKQTDGTYSLNAANSPPHPDKHMQFPEQRTYSEWANSLFASGPVNLAGRFGGAGQAYSSCQDCHMQTTEGEGCALGPPLRPDLPQHNFTGANSWVLKAVASLYDQNETNLYPSDVDAAIARAAAHMAASCDLQLSAVNGNLNVRVVNFTGHKLPTGYMEGRRMWINVKFKDAGGAVIAERGGYDLTTATLTESNTKVYEAKIGTDGPLAVQLGRAEGPNFHLAISNKRYKDNRIPPMGFTNAAFNAIDAGSVPAGMYQDGQYWDDTLFVVPRFARTAEVTVYHQTTSREYVEFLRDSLAGLDGRGQIAYDQWVMHGKSAPVLMKTGTQTLPCRCEWDGNGVLNIDDIFIFLNSWFAGQGDFDQDGVNSIDDIFIFLNCWFAACAGY